MTQYAFLQPYNILAPYYTSYPTIPYWQKDKPTEEAWSDRAWHAFAHDHEVSLYIHLPFCEGERSVCGDCKRITSDHGLERPYIDSVLQEWELYLKKLPDKPLLREIFIGGRAPTFFSPTNLDYLLTRILGTADISPEHEFGFEAHLYSTTQEHLETLSRLGFRRIRLSVQDIEPGSLKIINRQQTQAKVRDISRWAREAGFTSLHFDLIYGLPGQTPEHIRQLMAEVEQLRPERIAFYHYEIVPWLKVSKTMYAESSLQQNAEKRALYNLGHTLLVYLGYREIGLDHFVLPQDSLLQAAEMGTLHRNFMGYTPYYSRLSIGLGVSAISDSWDAFIQNEKSLENYQYIIARGHLPIARGHLLTKEDQALRTHILNIMCRFETNWQLPELQCPALEAGLKRLEPLKADGLLDIFPFQLRVTQKGKPFLRTICLTLDAHFWDNQPQWAGMI